ncbi:MAG: DUF3102 domain-containing protein, partial [Selenomonadaceae bacterium]|nr:DUF3102 domain-containing protein [Selenomonadaceae bacterium]
MEKNSLREVSRQSGVPLTTLSRWKNEGKLAPDVADDKGELTFYSKAQIETARKLDQERKAKTADKTECACAGGNGDNSDSDQAVEVVDEREDDGSNDDPDVDTTAVDELHESITTPAQIDKIQGVDVAADNDRKVDSETPAVNTPMTIETTAEFITLDVRANRIRRLQADVQRGVIEIGFELIAAKKEVGHGNWERWLQNEFEWTVRTARNFMAIAERFGNRKTFSDLKPSTLQAMLALPAGDEEKFIETQAETGKPVEKLSAREVQKAVKEYKAASNPTNTFSFEDKHDQAEVRGEEFKVWQDSP